MSNKGCNDVAHADLHVSAVRSLWELKAADKSDSFWEEQYAKNDHEHLTCSFRYFERNNELDLTGPPPPKSIDCTHTSKSTLSNNNINVSLDDINLKSDNKLQVMDEQHHLTRVERTSLADVPECDDYIPTVNGKQYVSTDGVIYKKKKIETDQTTTIQVNPKEQKPTSPPRICVNNEDSNKKVKPKLSLKRRGGTPMLALITERLMQCNLTDKDDAPTSYRRRTSVPGLSLTQLSNTDMVVNNNLLDPEDQVNIRRKSSPLRDSVKDKPLLPPHKVLQFALNSNLETINISNIHTNNDRYQTYAASFVVFFIIGALFGFIAFFILKLGKLLI